MIFRLAWRNIWRVKSRSFVVIGAVTVGIWAVLFLVGYMLGVVNTLIKNTIENQVSHLQIHHTDFKRDKEIKYYLENADSLIGQVRQLTTVKGATSRSLVNAMIAAPKGVKGILVKGIVPESEAAVTKLNEKILEGEYLDHSGKNTILIGKQLADKLNISLRKKVVLTFQDINGDITSGAFRISGFYKTHNSTFDEMTAFIDRDNLNELLGLDGTAHEIAILLNNIEDADGTRDELQNQFSGTHVETFREIAPDINLYDTQMNMSVSIIMTIIMLALIFGIINTMLMAVMDRYRELGMLMSIGMNKRRLFSMIMLETILLSLVALPIGLLIGYVSVSYFGKYGIDLSTYSKGLNQFGMSEIIYPSLTGDIYFQLAIMVVITAILAAIYPALKAIRLKPAEAIRKL